MTDLKRPNVKNSRCNYLLISSISEEESRVTDINFILKALSRKSAMKRILLIQCSIKPAFVGKATDVCIKHTTLLIQHSVTEIRLLEEAHVQ